MIRHAPFIVPALLALAACATTTATLEPAQCARDWRAVGYADGRDGASETKIRQYREACARGDAPLSDAEAIAWGEGWREARAARQDEYEYEHEPAPRRSPSYPRIYPQVGIGVGSGGVSVGGGLGLGAFGLGLYY